MGAARTAVLRVVTRCRTVEELVVALEPYTDEDSIVFGSDKPRPIGSRRRFVLELLDGSPAMRGEVEIVESSPAPVSRLRVRLLALDGPGRDVHTAILDRIAGRAPKAASKSGSLPVVKIPDGKPITPALGVPLPRRRADDLTPIPAPPPRALATARTRVDDLFPAATGEMEAFGPDPAPRATPKHVVVPVTAPEPAPEPDVAAAALAAVDALDQLEMPDATPVPAPVREDRRTTRMAGLAPPNVQPPRFEIAARKDTTRMAPLFEHTVSDEAE